MPGGRSYLPAALGSSCPRACRSYGLRSARWLHFIPGRHITSHSLWRNTGTETDSLIRHRTQRDLPIRTKRKLHAIGGARGVWSLPVRQAVRVNGVSYQTPQNPLRSDNDTIIISTDATPSPGISRVSGRRTHAPHLSPSPLRLKRPTINDRKETRSRDQVFFSGVKRLTRVSALFWTMPVCPDRHSVVQDGPQYYHAYPRCDYGWSRTLLPRYSDPARAEQRYSGA